MRDTRETLIAVAAALLEEGGPAAVTLREVGAQAGVSRTAPYRHFAGKEDLLAAVAARALRQRHAARTRRRPASALDAVRADLLHFVQQALAHPELFRLTYGRWTVDSAELAEAASTSRAALVQLVTAAQHERALPAGDPERVTALITAVAHGACHLALNGHLSPTGKGHATPHDLVNDLFDQLARTPRRRRATVDEPTDARLPAPARSQPRTAAANASSSRGMSGPAGW